MVGTKWHRRMDPAQVIVQKYTHEIGVLKQENEGVLEEDSYTKPLKSLKHYRSVSQESFVLKSDITLGRN